MKTHHIKLFEQLIEACGVSGYTTDVATIFLGEAERLGYMVGKDSLGSASAVLKARIVSSNTRSNIMISAHIDHVGYVVAEKLTAENKLKLYKVGVPYLEGTHKGKLKTLLKGKLNVIITDPGEEEYYALADISPADMDAVLIGDPVYCYAPLSDKPRGKYTAPHLDNKASIISMLIAMEEIVKLDIRDRNLFFVLTEFEEIGGYGAIAATNKIKPEFVINLDVFPVVNKSRLSYGTTISRGPIYNDNLTTYAATIANQYNIPFELQTTSPEDESDSNMILPQNGGTPCCEIGPPCYNVHLPDEIVSKKSLIATAKLLTHMCKDIHQLIYLIPGGSYGM